MAVETETTTPATVITGASGGIGAALALEFAREGATLLLVARSTDALAAVAEQARAAGSPRVETLTADLGDRSAADVIESTVSGHGWHVHELVNNAGFGLRGRFAELSEDEQLDMLDLNVRTLTALTRRFLPGMLARGRGGVMHMASVASFLPGPHMAVYYATKGYVLSFSEALADEVRGSGVAVTAVCPGPTPTGFQSRAHLEGARMLDLTPSLSAERVAALSLRGFRRNRRVVVPGFSNQLIAGSARLTPKPVLLAMTRWLQA